MSVYIDRKYLGSVSHKLERFSQKNTDLYNFRCPFCGDSQKNKLKSRGYVYCKGNDYFFRCHNCSMSTSFGNFLKQIDQSVYKEYILERYSAGDNAHSNYQKPTFDALKGNAFGAFAKFTQSIPKIKLENINQLEKDHYAREYISDRSIPISRWNDIYYADNFKEFLDSEFPTHNVANLPEDDRIVLLYKDELGNITDIAGRALGDNKLRYITVKVQEGKKVYGLERVNRENTAYIVEGQFDSMFIDNCLASGDSNLIGLADYLDIKCVLIYDAEPRNKEIVKQIATAIDLGYTICLLPTDMNGKDINEMVINGLDPSSVMAMIHQNTVHGLEAKMKFINWKKV